MSNLHFEKFADGTVKCIEDEIPFELPSGWGWTRIGNIASVKGGKRVPKGMTFSTEPTHHAYVRVTDMKNHTVNLSDLKYIDETVFAEIKNYTIAKNDLYITIAGTIGAVGEFPDELDGMNLTENAVKVSAIGINKSFLCFIMQTEFVQKQFKHKTYQVAMPKLGLERILTTLIPVCGIVTQQKICDAIQNSTKYIDIIGENYSGLSDTIAVIKSKILDLAIRGKLVPQNPDDEPVSALLERIRAEKEVLIKQGKIKRDKKESVIFKGEDNSYYLNDGSTDINITNELPFNIPASWRWAQINNVLIVNPRNKLDDELEASFVPMPLINDGYSGKHTAEVRKWKDIKTGFTHFSEGDVGVAKISPCFENLKSTVFENLSNGYGAGTTELYILRPYKDTILARYLLMYIKSDYFIRNGKQTCTGDVGQQRVRKDYVESAYFPIPPLNEQHRIVEAIETAFSQLDAIAETLN